MIVASLLLIHVVQSTASEVRVWSIELTKVVNSLGSSAAQLYEDDGDGEYSY